jgi:hypothetical protein
MQGSRRLAPVHSLTLAATIQVLLLKVCPHEA